MCIIYPAYSNRMKVFILAHNTLLNISLRKGNQPSLVLSSDKFSSVVKQGNRKFPK